MTYRARGIALLSLVAIACADRPAGFDGAPLPTMAEVPVERWRALDRRTVFFGHQSVGTDIVAGMVEILEESPLVGLEVIETTDAARLAPGTFAHAKVGRNFSYQSKLDAFAAVMNEGLGDHVDVAMLKFCFVDVLAETDVETMFADYVGEMARLGERYPRTTFVYVTEPLTWHLSGGRALERRAKDFVKSLLGMPEYGRFFDNRNRNRLNRMLRGRFAGGGRLLDIAAVESTFPDGRRNAFSLGADVEYAMVPEYTADGGHLTASGRRHVAEQLLIFLAELELPAPAGPASDGPLDDRRRD